MRMTLVTYRKTFNLGSYTSESIGVEMELNEGDNATEALDNCSALVEEYHQKTLAELETYRGTSVRDIIEPAVQINKVPDELQGALDGIDKCQDMSELKGWWTLSKSNLKLSQAYKAKEKQLTDAK